MQIFLFDSSLLILEVLMFLGFLFLIEIYLTYNIA